MVLCSRGGASLKEVADKGKDSANVDQCLVHVASEHGRGQHWSQVQWKAPKPRQPDHVHRSRGSSFWSVIAARANELQTYVQKDQCEHPRACFLRELLRSRQDKVARWTLQPEQAHLQHQCEVPRWSTLQNLNPQDRQFLGAMSVFAWPHT